MMEHHRQSKVYTLDGNAFDEYHKIHDDLVEMKLKTTNENAQGILSKARGYAARIAMIVHVLEQALERLYTLPTTTSEWKTSVSVTAVKAAGVIIRHFNSQKFIMLGLEESHDDNNLVIPKKVVKVLSIETKNNDGIILPSEVSQKHISEKVGPSYPIAKAVEILEQAVQLGFGTMEDILTPNKRKTKRFRKRPLSDISEECKQELKRAHISDEVYGRAFLPQDNSNPITEEYTITTTVLVNSLL